MSDKLIITGTVGVNQELVELHNNFPRFNLLHPKEESEQELLIRVKKQNEQILKNLKELKVKDDYVYLSNEGSTPNETHTAGRESPTNCAPSEDRAGPAKLTATIVHWSLRNPFSSRKATRSSPTDSQGRC